MWVGIGNEDVKQFPGILKRVEGTNIFPFVLKDDLYNKVDEYTYEKGSDDLIEIYQRDGKWQYQNLRNTEDRGSIVQFIANRWNDGKIKISKNPATMFLAAKVADTYSQTLVKKLKQESKLKGTVLQSVSHKKRRR